MAASSPPPAGLGVPVAVDPDIIEAALAALWRSDSEAPPDTAGVRACSCNLVVLAQGPDQAAAAQQVLADVSGWHPNRGVVAFLDDPGPAGPPFRAWISAHCALPVRGASEVCCETIAVGARPEGGNKIADMLLSLVVPDLPLFVYARSLGDAQRGVLERMAPAADLLIVDSHDWKTDAGRRERLLEVLLRPPAGAPVRDLNWSRLTEWRDLVAQFFDAPEARDRLAELAHVEIVRTVGEAGNIPTRTLLVTGWLASRLRWQRLAAERTGDTWVSRWQGPGGEVTVLFTGEPAAGSEAPGIRSLTLRTRSGATFTVARDAAGCMSSLSTVAGNSVAHTVPGDPADESALLVRELSIPGEDPSFKAALAEALELERSFRP